MSVDDSLLSSARENPGGIWFNDAVTLALQLGWQEMRRRGSHVIFRHPMGHLIRQNYPLPLNLQRGNNGKAKAYQIRQMLAMAEVMGIIDRE